MNSYLYPHNAWESARGEFAEWLLVFEPKGRQIGDQARAGDPLAKEVVRLYTMLSRSFDPMTFILLKTAFSEWKNGQKTVV